MEKFPMDSDGQGKARIDRAGESIVEFPDIPEKIDESLLSHVREYIDDEDEAKTFIRKLFVENRNLLERWNSIVDIGRTDRNKASQLFRKLKKDLDERE